MLQRYTKLEDRVGRCYELAGKAILCALSRPVILVHGELDLRKNGRALHYPHAWLEIPDGWIYDPVLDVLCPSWVYDAGLAPSNRVRYSPKEARQMMLQFRHWGPWA